MAVFTDRKGNTVYQVESYRDCKWCRGRGCLCCQAEIERIRAENAKPVFSCKVNNKKGMAYLREAIGRESLDDAFSNNDIETAQKIIRERLLIAGIRQAISEIEEK